MHDTPLADKRMADIRERANKALLNADPKFIESLVRLYKENPYEEEYASALDMLDMFAKMAYTLANDIDQLLAQNAALRSNLEANQKLVSLLSGVRK